MNLSLQNNPVHVLWNKWKRPMHLLKFNTLIAAICFTVSACAVSPKLEMSQSGSFITKKANVEVAVIIPESSRNFNRGSEEPGGG